MSREFLIAADLVAAATLAFALYFPRYRRRDVVVAVIAVNVAVLAISTALSSVEVGLGLGFGLFAVLSIIRIRSTTLDPEEIAYYLSAIALGVLGGVQLELDWLAPALMVTIVGSLFITDNPRLFARSRQQTVTLDAVYTDEGELVARLEDVLAAKVNKVKVKRIDLVRDRTTVDVRYRIDDP